MELTFQIGAVLLLIAAMVAMLSRRLHLPYSVGLVAVGIVLAFLPFAPSVNLRKALILTALLPPLLFEAALYIHWDQFRKDFLVIALLATLGVLLSAGITVAEIHYRAHRQWLGALVFGVLIAQPTPLRSSPSSRKRKLMVACWCLSGQKIS